jgi:cytochrome c-type biogenesis protein CcsB
MAQLSDQLLLVTVLAYVVAMIAYAAQYAFGDRGLVAKAAARPATAARAAKQPALAGASGIAAGGVPGQPAPFPSGTGVDSSSRRVVLLGRTALVALLAAAALHLAATVTRGLAAERMPWGNMYEFILSTTLIGVVAWLVILLNFRAVQHLSLFVALVNVLLLGVAWVVFYSPIDPLVPALDSAWFIIHIAAAALASGIFLVGFVTAWMYLLRAGYERGVERGFLPVVAARLPSAATVERLTFRLHAFAFPIWTFAVVAGAIWAEAAWGRYWAWDPKEVWAFITWVVYAAYLHARATPSVKANVAAWLAIIGWLTMLMNLFGVNVFFESLHSYA